MVAMSATGCCKETKPENAARNFPNPAPVLSNARIVRILEERGKSGILEVGGGCLRNAIYLRRHGYPVSVLEVPQMRARFPDRYELFERLGGCVLTSIPARVVYAIAISTFVIETICDPKKRAALLKTVASHMHYGGCLVVSVRGPRDLVTATAKGVRCSDGFITPNRSFARSYTRNQLQRLLVPIGFKRLEFLHKRTSFEPELLHAIAWMH